MRAVTVILMCAASAVAGCGVSDPYNEREQSSRGEDSRSSSKADTAGARRALERFAEIATNWSSHTLAKNRRDLAVLASGDLKAVLLRDARQAENDAAGATAGWRTSGRVEGVLLRGGTRALVVTREVTHFGEGGDQPSFLVYLARVELTDDGWRVVEWQPTS